MSRRTSSRTPKPVLGTWDTKPGTIAANAVGRVSILDLGAMPDECLIETTVTIAPGTAGCGLLLRADAAFDGYYQLRFEPDKARLVMDRWPRPGDQPFMLEQPCWSWGTGKGENGSYTRDVAVANERKTNN